MSKLKVSTISDPDNDNTAISVDSSGNVTFAQNATFSGGTTGINVSGGAESDLANAANVTLTSSSSKVLNISFTADNLSVILPDATTLGEGQQYSIINSGDYDFFLENDGGSVLFRITAGNIFTIYLLDNSTSDGSWSIESSTYLTGTTFVNKLYDTSVTAVERGSSLASIGGDKVAYAYRDGNTVYVNAATISSGAYTVGTPASFTVSRANIPDNRWCISVVKADTDSAVVLWWEEITSTTWKIYGRAISVSGETVTLGSATAISATASEYISSLYSVYLSAGKFVTQSGYYLSSPNSWYSDFTVCSVSGTTITVGSTGYGYSDNTGDTVLAAADSGNEIHSFMQNSSTASDWMRYSSRYDISGTSLSNRATYDNGQGVYSYFEMTPFVQPDYTIFFTVDTRDAHNITAWDYNSSSSEFEPTNISITGRTGEHLIWHLGTSGTVYTMAIAYTTTDGYGFKKFTYDSSTNTFDTTSSPEVQIATYDLHSGNYEAERRWNGTVTGTLSDGSAVMICESASGNYQLMQINVG